jgi:hypothetical protein
MQRRAAAAYVALFLVVGAGAYATIGVAEKPQVEMDGPTYSVNDELTVDDRTYVLAEVESGGGSLAWTDPDASESASIENNATVSWQTVSWEGQAVDETTLSDGQTVRYNGSDYTVSLNATADPATATFQQADNPSINDTYEVGGQISLTIDGEYLPGRTITSVTDSEATLAVGDDYLVSIPDDADPTEAEMIQQFNVTRLLLEEPTLANDTSTIEGVEVVTNKTTNQNQPLSEFLPDPEVYVVTESDTLTYEGAEWTVGNITAENIPLTRQVTANNSVPLADGSTVALGPNDVEYLVHLQDNTTVQLLENTSSTWNTYQSELAVIDNYNERMAGLWGVVILCFAASLILGATAYLPVKD